MAQLIGLVGAAGSGKSYAAERLELHHGFTRVSFGEGIKAAVRGILESSGMHIPHAHIDSIVRGDHKDAPIKAFGGATSRDVQIAIGQGLRALTPDFWVNFARKKVETALLTGQSVVIDDIRQPNEAALVKEHSGVVVRINAYGIGLPEVSDLKDIVDYDFAVDNWRGPKNEQPMKPVDKKIIGAVQQWNITHGIPKGGW